jgi:hypothetical protein
VIADWWSSPGAIVLLTGVVAAAVAGVPLLLRPWVDRRAEQRQREQDWRDGARELAADLEEHLLKMELDELLGYATTPIMSAWPHGLRRKTRLVVRFGPDGTADAGSALLAAMSELHDEANTVCQLPRDDRSDPRWPAAQAGYDATLGRADAALKAFETAIGGP